jgi:hypothetical protein
LLFVVFFRCRLFGNPFPTPFFVRTPMRQSKEPNQTENCVAEARRRLAKQAGKKPETTAGQIELCDPTSKPPSSIAYGQDGVQVAWSRGTHPDASSIDLDGMLGADSHGNPGLRDKVNRHCCWLIGFSVLTRMSRGLRYARRPTEHRVVLCPLLTSALTAEKEGPA